MTETDTQARCLGYARVATYQALDVQLEELQIGIGQSEECRLGYDACHRAMAD